MYYVEYLRALRALRVVAIILGILLALAVVMRLWLATVHAESPDAWVAQMAQSSTAVVRTQRLPDGTVKTTIDDKGQRTNVDIYDRGYAGKRVVITAPSSQLDMHLKHPLMIGSMHVVKSGGNGMTTVVVDSNGGEDIGGLFIVSLPLALIVATILGGALAKENDGHLEVAWTRPVSRLVYALTAMGVDVAALAATEVLAVVVFVLAQALFQMPRYGITTQGFQALSIALLVPAAWYALVTACSASLRRGLGAVIGMLWPVAILLPVFAAVRYGDSVMARTASGLLRAVDTLNPLIYLPGFSPDGVTSGLSGLGLLGTSSLWASILVLIALTVAYSAAAIVQWWGVEA